jgi:hypothetical protein
MRLWRYVVRNDCGSAPNYDPPFTTLAVCKPKVRKGAKPGDLVMAFAGREIARHDPHRVVWAGVVREKLTFEDYWADPRFRSKKPDATDLPDNIYRPGPRGLAQVPNPIHDHRNVVRDCGGRFVLVMEPAWHLNPEASSLPVQFEQLRMLPGNRRGHRISELTGPMADELFAWIGSRAQPRESRVRTEQDPLTKAVGVPAYIDRSGYRCRPEADAQMHWPL